MRYFSNHSLEYEWMYVLLKLLFHTRFGLSRPAHVRKRVWRHVPMWRPASQQYLRHREVTGVSFFFFIFFFFFWILSEFSSAWRALSCPLDLIHQLAKSLTLDLFRGGVLYMQHIPRNEHVCFLAATRGLSHNRSTPVGTTISMCFLKYPAIRLTHYRKEIE